MARSILPEPNRLAATFVAASLLALLAGCASTPQSTDLYGIWMNEGVEKFSVTFIVGSKCEVRTYDQAGNTDTTQPCTWRINDANVVVQSPSGSHDLTLSGNRLADGSWSLIRN